MSNNDRWSDAELTEFKKDFDRFRAEFATFVLSDKEWKRKADEELEELAATKQQIAGARKAVIWLTASIGACWAAIVALKTNVTIMWK